MLRVWVIERDERFSKTSSSASSNIDSRSQPVPCIPGLRMQAPPCRAFACLLQCPQWEGQLEQPRNIDVKGVITAIITATMIHA